MEMKWLAFTMLILPFAVLAGCIGDTTIEGDLKYMDPLGAEVILEDVPQRIVTLSPALTETVFALGSGDNVIATDDTSNYPPQAADLPNVFSYLGLDLESLISVEPDLVIMDKTLDISEDGYNSIKGAGIPVYRIYPRSVEDVLEAITGIGEITGTEDEAKDLVDDFNSRFDSIKDVVSGWGQQNRSKVLLVSFYDGTSDPWVSTDSTMAGGLIKAAGGVNAVSDDTGIVVQVPVETIVGANPDIIICTQSTVWPTPSRTTILSDEGWKDIQAVKDGQVHDVNGDLVDRTGPRLIEGLEALHGHIFDLAEA